MFGLDTVLSERLNDFQPGQDTQVAVVAPAGSDGVDVTTRHGRRAFEAARAYRDHVADPVDGDVKAEVPHPGNHQVPP